MFLIYCSQFRAVSVSRWSSENPCWNLVRGHSSTMCWMVYFFVPHYTKGVFTNVPMKQHFIAFAMAGSKAVLHHNDFSFLIQNNIKFCNFCENIRPFNSTSTLVIIMSKAWINATATRSLPLRNSWKLISRSLIEAKDHQLPYYAQLNFYDNDEVIRAIQRSIQPNHQMNSG
jgi:hypothetical protein